MAARGEGSGLGLMEGVVCAGWLGVCDLVDRMGGKAGSDFSLTGGKGPGWSLGIYEDSFKVTGT